MKYTFDDLVSFAKANGLTVKLLDQGSYYIFVFRDEEKGDEYRHCCDVGKFESSFHEIIQAVIMFFCLNTGPLPVAQPTMVVEQHRTNICGLTKHEYIALELTKAWASTRAQGHQNECEIVAQYEYILDEIKRRNL